MYGFDIGMHVGENIRETERKEKALAAESRARAKAHVQAQAQAQAQIQAQAQSQAQAQTQATAEAKVDVQAKSGSTTQSRSQLYVARPSQVPNQPQAPSQGTSQKQKPGPMMMPFNVFQDQMRKGSPVSSLQPPGQRPGGPNRALSFPNFPAGFPKTPISGSSSGLNSLANSAYNSPLPSPGLTGPAKKAWFPFGPTTEGDESTTTSVSWLALFGSSVKTTTDLFLKSSK